MLTALTFAATVLLSVQVLLVAVIGALRPKGNVYVTILAVSVATSPLVLVFAEPLLGEPLGREGRLFMVVIHWTLGGFLFHFMTLPDRSVTLRILVELLLAPGQTLSTEALRHRYAVGTMIMSRLEQMSTAGFIEISADNRITLTGKGRLFGRVVTAGRSLFGIASAN